MSTSRPMLVASRASITVPGVLPSPEVNCIDEGSERRLKQDSGDEISGSCISKEGSESRSTSAKSAYSLNSELAASSVVSFDTDLEIEEEAEDFDLSGTKIYMETCRELDVVPASFFTKNMRNSVLTMKHHGLGPQGAKAIAVPLVSNTVVNSLDLEDNWIEAGGATYIADMLKENCYISNLNLAKNNIGSAASKALCEMLLVNATLTKVNLSGNGFKDSDGKYFAQVILENGQIQHMNLSHNALGETCGDVLGHAIGENETLESLDLSWNNFRKDSGVKLVDGIQVNSRLKRVNLSWNGLGLEGSMAISNCLKNNSILTELDVSNNRLSQEGVVPIAKGLEANETLQILKIGNNPFGPAGAMVLLNAINNERSMLTELDLTDIWVEKDFDVLQKEMLQSRSSLVVTHGGIIGNYVLKGIYSKSKEGETDLEKFLRTNTWAIIRDHVNNSKLNVNEVFKPYDKEGQGRVTCADFKQCIQVQKIPLDNSQVNDLHERLEAIADAEGKVNYREIFDGTY